MRAKSPAPRKAMIARVLTRRMLQVRVSSRSPLPAAETAMSERPTGMSLRASVALPCPAVLSSHMSEPSRSVSRALAGSDADWDESADWEASGAEAACPAPDCAAFPDWDDSACWAPGCSSTLSTERSEVMPTTSVYASSPIQPMTSPGVPTPRATGAPLIERASMRTSFATSGKTPSRVITSAFEATTDEASSWEGLSTVSASAPTMRKTSATAAAIAADAYCLRRFTRITPRSFGSPYLSNDRRPALRKTVHIRIQ